MFAEIWAFLAGLSILKWFILYFLIGLLIYTANVFYVVKRAYKNSIVGNKFEKERFNRLIEDEDVFTIRLVVVISMWWVVLIAFIWAFFTEVFKPNEWLADYLEKRHKTKNPQGYI
jgi:Trk-type K+ transport system membrane component